MITVKSSVQAVMGSILQKMLSIDKERILREAAFNTLASMKDRIHVNGIAADGTQIGTYTPGYLRFRQRGFQSDKVTRGKHKGEARSFKTLNRTGDSKVISSLTRTMENDMVVVATGTGYTIGYTNKVNFNKAAYVEETYRKRIFALTAGERQAIKDLAQYYVKNQ
jgi:hypothetical protein